MKFSIEVGQLKKHQIDYEFNQLLGRLIIKLDHKEVKRRVRLINEPVTENHLLHVGAERLMVRIKKERRQVLGCRCAVYLNERLLRCYEEPSASDVSVNEA